MDFSVIIPTYNASKTIERCVNSMLNQSLIPDIAGEVIVVDDGSTDDTLDKLKTIRSNEPTLHIVEHEQNRGRAVARNSGLKQATGDMLFFLDSDMTAEPEYIQSHFQYYKVNSQITGIVNKYVRGNEVPVNKFTKYLYRKNRGAAKVGEGGNVPTHQVLIGCTSMRRTVYDQVGGFDENIVSYGGEDTEFAFRIAKQTESRFIYTQKTVLQHHHYRSLQQTRKLLYEYGRESLPYLINKYPDLAKHVGLDAVGLQVDRTYSPLRKRFLLSSVTEKIMHFFYMIFPPPLSHPFVRYLLGVDLLRGYFEGH